MEGVRKRVKESKWGRKLTLGSLERSYDKLLLQKFLTIYAYIKELHGVNKYQGRQFCNYNIVKVLPPNKTSSARNRLQLLEL